MKNEENINKIYDLLEVYDFSNLSESDKKIVLQEMYAEEYNKMRSSIKDSKELFSKISIDNKKSTDTRIKRISTYKIELYKVAAIFLVFFGLTYFTNPLRISENKNLLTYIDTVIVEKTDTLFVEIKDTIEIIKEKIIYLNSNLLKEETFASVQNSVPNFNPDCITELCPSDIEILNKLKTQNNISKDSILEGFVVMIE